ncbi:MAG: peptidoglycan-associated lipoprotein Pal [Gammaproteobacteria bacterium]|jgi:peptidoglycan-associated lipoprotein
MINRIITILAITVMLSACDNANVREDADVVEGGTSSGGSQSSDTGNTTSFGTDSDSRTGLSLLDDPASPLSVRILYFEYDSSDILPAYREVLEAHANYLLQNPNITISLEGHADERGSREYNLALGEKRSQSAKQRMIVLGPSSSQIRTTSYGEERPVVDGHDDESWSQNRRVEIIY